MANEKQVKGISIERKNKPAPKKSLGKNARKALTIVESVLILAFSFSVVFLGINFFFDQKSEKKMNDIRAEVKASRLQFEKISIPEEEKKQNNGKKEKRIEQANSNKTAGAATADLSDEDVLPVYKKLHEENENIAGWLYVDGTNLEYPIMQGPDNKFYLSHDIDGAYDKYGMLILDENCNIAYECPQLIIYGHNVNSGKLFGELLFYKEEAYCKYHPEICFDTIYNRGTYTVFAVVTTTVNEAEKDGKMFSNWNFADKKTYDDFVSWAKSRSLYQIDYTPKYKDEILSLVTCEHSDDEGRFIVFAARNDTLREEGNQQ